MVNLVRIAPTTAKDDPQIEAAKQQIAMAMAQMRGGGPSAAVPIAEGRGAVQAKYGIGNALTDLANKLAQGYVLGQANRQYGDLKTQQDAALTEQNKAKLASLSPAITQGGQVPLQTQLAAVPGEAQKFNPSADLASALAGRQSGMAAPSGTDQPTTLTTNAAVPDQMNPAHAQIASLLAGMDPRAANALLSGIQARNAFPDPAVVESAKMREAMFKQTEADKAATLADRQQGREETLADRQQGREESLALRRQLAGEAASTKAQTAADASDAMDAKVEMAAKYDAPPPAGMGSNTPTANLFWKKMKAYQEAHPEMGVYDAKKYQTYQRGRNAFTSGTQGNTVRSLNVAVQHMNTMEGMIDALKNGDYQLFNSMANAAGVYTGDAPVTNFKMGAAILGTEVEKALIQNGGTGTERTEAKSRFSAAQSPQQLRGALNVGKQFLGGQLKGLIKQGTAATGWTEDEFKQQLLLPDSLQATGMGGQKKTSGGVTVSNWH